jgi:hypothetical protein
LSLFAIIDSRTIGVADLKGGTQRLDVRFVQFDNVVLLQYRDARQPMGAAAVGRSLATT